MPPHAFRALSFSIALFCAWSLRPAPAAAQATASTGKTVQLVVSGKPAAAIVLAPQTPASTRRAVDDLVAYISQSTGATLPIEQISADARVELHIGPTDYARSLKLPSGDLETDGYTIAFPAPNRIVLLGGSDSGTECAIYDFIERYLGVRWLFPGDLGTCVPKTSDIAIPAGEPIISRPAYISRTISTMACAEPGNPVFLWLQRHRRHWTIQHHHNFNNLFPPKQYFKTHPEFYPDTGGNEPAADGDGWQPVLDAPGIVEEAVKNINRFFDEHPSELSYSLGINDTNNFARPPEGINSVGDGDYSNYYYGFANRVAEGVLKAHPDKWFGCLAYVGITDPPRGFRLNPRIVPHICIDRQGWASEAGARRDMERTEQWEKAAPVLGWYDYIYGDDMYRIPRVYPHLMGRYIKFGAEHGVKAYYAELYASPAWIDGPKMYVLMNLLWDPNADVDALLNEWYRLAVGEKAAVPLAKYYGLWEDYWMKRVPKTDWFKQYVGRVYFDFDHTGYLDELNAEDLAECQRLLQEVVSLAETPEQKARAQFIAQGFHDLRRDVDYVIRLRGKTVADSAKASAIIWDSFAPSGPADEKVPSPWAGWQNAPGTARFYWDHKTGYKDSHSLAIDLKGAGTGAVFYRDLKVEKPNALYHLGAVVQCNGINPDASIGIQIRWSRADGKYLPRKYTANQFYSASAFKDGVWTPLDVFARPPAGVGELSANVTLTVYYSKEGTIRFDDVKLGTVDSEKDLQPRQ